jgi:hypothetical protein
MTSLLWSFLLTDELPQQDTTTLRLPIRVVSQAIAPSLFVQFSGNGAIGTDHNLVGFLQLYMGGL